MAAIYEMSKTYQYRKVQKPLLERKRRARINKCLDDLKDLMAECLQENDPSAKLEKADILELTVQHLRKVKAQKQPRKSSSSHASAGQSFRSGYIQAANEVSHCLAALPNINTELGKRLMTQLGLRLRQLESMQTENQRSSAFDVPLAIDCSNYARSVQMKVTPCSPVPSLESQTESGYASDSSDLSQRSSNNNKYYQQNQLLRLAKNEDSIWRPW